MANDKFDDEETASSTSGDDKHDFCSRVLLWISWLIIFATFPLSLIFCLKIIREYERAVIFRLGRLVRGGARGPGMFFIVPCVDTLQKVDLRTVSFDVPPQEILTKDSVTVSVDAVVYFRTLDAIVSVTMVEDAARSTRLLAQTTLRNTLGMRTLSEILGERESISLQIQSILDNATDKWGIKVERVEVKDVRLPVNLQRSMAAEAEASRAAKAKLVAAEGEQKAAGALAVASEVLYSSPFALQLRYLQTLSAISGDKNKTVVLPVPIGLIKKFMERWRKKNNRL